VTVRAFFRAPRFASVLVLSLSLSALLIAASGCHSKPTPVQTPPDAGRVAKSAPPDAADAVSKAAVEVLDATADDALPPVASAEMTTRAKHLLEAVQKDDATLATDIVFPRDAYLAVKDAVDPGKQWDTQVRGLFQKQVHALHRKTKGIERAVFTSFELGQSSEALPKKKDLRRMLWRTKRSRVAFTVDGKPSHFDIVEMTGWRGSWYVTKLK